MTPAETLVLIQVHTEKIKFQSRQALIMAWHTAALSRAKRMPSLQELLRPRGGQRLQGKELQRRRAERDELLKRIDIAAINRSRRVA